MEAHDYGSPSAVVEAIRDCPKISGCGTLTLMAASFLFVIVEYARPIAAFFHTRAATPMSNSVPPPIECAAATAPVSW